MEHDRQSEPSYYCCVVGGDITGVTQLKEWLGDWLREADEPKLRDFAFFCVGTTGLSPPPPPSAAICSKASQEPFYGLNTHLIV